MNFKSFKVKAVNRQNIKMPKLQYTTSLQRFIKDSHRKDKQDWTPTRFVAKY